MSDGERVTITCAGGCGRSVTLRKSKVHPADYYLCASKASGSACNDTLPPLRAGMVRRVDLYAAGSFWGYTDEWPDVQTAASVMRARRIRDIALAQLREKE